eukprot:362025-Chlamydomonas_euryale.AAC.4
MAPATSDGLDVACHPWWPPMAPATSDGLGAAYYLWSWMVPAACTDTWWLLSHSAASEASEGSVASQGSDGPWRPALASYGLTWPQWVCNRTPSRGPESQQQYAYEGRQGL